LKPEFLVKIAEGNAQSDAFLRGMLAESFRNPVLTAKARIRLWLEILGKSSLERRILKARECGLHRGYALAAQHRGKINTNRLQGARERKSLR